MYPCDEVRDFLLPLVVPPVLAHTLFSQDEKDRMDIYHKLFEVSRRGALHVTPIIENDGHPARILDLGCGTGIWAIDMAE